jgi:hypothetical protein
MTKEWQNQTVCYNMTTHSKLNYFQLSIKLYFAMIINKAQSQSLKEVEIYLREECSFRYVASSKASSAKGLYTLVPTGKTTL